MMSVLVVNTLSICVGLYVAFLGSLKLSPAISEDAHKELRKIYIRQINKGFPLANITGYKPNPHSYRRFVGDAEVICGLILVISPLITWLFSHRAKLRCYVERFTNLCNLYLILQIVGDMVQRYLSGMTLAKASTPLVFALLLACRLIVFYQTTPEATTTSGSSSGEAEGKDAATSSSSSQVDNSDAVDLTTRKTKSE